MALAQEFDYFKPDTTDAALALKAQYGERARFLAGGTDLINNLDDEAVFPDALIDLKGIHALKSLEMQGDHLWVGALVTFSDLINSSLIKERFPLLWEASWEVASISIRNRATMAGNLCSCVPCMDSAPALLVHETSVVVHGSQGNRRTLPMDKFVKGPRKTALAPDELLMGLLVPEPASKHGTAYAKLKRYQGEDLSQAGVAVMALAEDLTFTYRVAFGSVGPVPTRATRIEALLPGQKLTEDLIAQAKALVDQEITPISDIRASKEYRLHICQVMLGRALEASVARLSGNGPQLGSKLL